MRVIGIFLSPHTFGKLTSTLLGINSAGFHSLPCAGENEISGKMHKKEGNYPARRSPRPS